MKSFGVRLAAGAVTILFGAYAAAVAQKDRQNKSDSWTAEVPSLGEPVIPIEGDASWLSAPSTTPVASTEEIATGAPGFESKHTVQLVQHTEPVAEESNESDAPTFDASMLPATLSEESAEPAPAVEAPNWTLPSETTESSAAPQAATPAMALPAVDIGTAPVAASEPTAAPSAGALPERNMNSAPAIEFAPDVQYFPAGTADGTQPGGLAVTVGPSTPAAEGNTAAPTSTFAAGPSNALRSDSGATNMLRSGQADAQGPNSIATSPDPSMAPAGLAQEAIGFAQPTQHFDQPTRLEAGSTAALGAPQQSYPGQESVRNPAFSGTQSSFNPQNFPASSQGGVVNLSNQAATTSAPTAMSQPAAALPIDPSATTDSPGDRRLEGAQSPSVIIQKRAPSEVKVGKPAAFVIQVQNVGSVEALDVIVQDRIPAGMRLIDASPTPVQQGNLLLWQLGSMPAGDERTVTMQLVPEHEGELGSVARVSFEAAASVRTISTRPELRVMQQAPERVLIGQQLEIELQVSNPGTGEATGVVLQEDVPEGLEHPKGRQLDNSLGSLAPGEVRNQVLRLRAVQPGIIHNTIRLTADDGLAAEHTVAVQVVAPDLKVDLVGPSRRFLERPATYQLNIANAGTADATNVEIAVQLDRGFTFVSTDYEGQYDPSRHAVYWSLAQLPAGEAGTVPLTLLPVEEGDQAIVIDARADLGVSAKTERKMSVEGFAELSFEITNPGGPIEVGAETIYQIRVTNSGSKPDSNIRLQLQLPSGLELISADAEAGTDGRGLIAFQPKAMLAPGEELKYSVRLRGVAAGTHLVKAVVVSDQGSVPVTKEESTLVYADQ